MERRIAKPFGPGRLVAALVLLALAALWFDVLLLAFAGVLVGVALHVPAARLRAWTGWRPGICLALVVLALAATLAAAAWAVAPKVAAQADQLGDRLPAAAHGLAARIRTFGWGRRLLDGGLHLQPQALLGAARAASGTLRGAVGLASAAVTGLFLAAEPELYLRGLLRLLPRPGRPEAEALLRACGRTLQAWLGGRLLGMAAVGLLTWAGLAALGLPLAFTLALLAALLDFVPNFGPLAAAIPGALLGLMDGPGKAAAVVGVYWGVQTLENYLVLPLVQRKTVDLPPALGLLAQLAMGVLAGPLGLVLASPLAAVALTVVRKAWVEDRVERD